ncbi:MAG: glycosyltransferase family 1 protein [Burkholderiales bacterium]|nr:MAG: glycosyltransferase family 1 protein [Burkholderiales bacterium]
MRVLYLGGAHPSSTSRHRADALRRLGCAVTHLDPQEAIAAQTKGRWLGALHYRTGYSLTRAVVESWLQRQLHGKDRFDLCWVDSGELLGPKAIADLRDRAGYVVLFNHDDPSGPRDRLRFMTLRAAIAQYSLCVVVRDINVAEFQSLGARDVMRVWMSYDEMAHRPLSPQAPVADIYRNDVVFIGRCMKGEGRDVLMHALIEQGIKPAIWGDNWFSSAVWPALQPYWRGAALSGQDYVDALRGAQICIGMLSKGNRDRHTTRTMEIPAAGGLLCAERTDEHLQLYVENEEAVFWDDARECAALCKRLLADPALARNIRLAGQRRLLANQVGNEDICRAVFKRLNLA